jgi:hypothetical protein
MYPGVGGVSGNVWRNLSSSVLNVVKKVIDLMSAGTVLNNAEAVEENEWNFIVLTLLNLELPRGLMHVIPRRPECWKTMLMSLGIKL